MRQKHELGSKIMREVFEEELNDLQQIMNVIKAIENYIKQKNKVQGYLNTVNQQYEKLIYGGSTPSQHKEYHRQQTKGWAIFTK